MTSEFEGDLANIRSAIADARDGFLRIVTELADGDLDRARRGGWPVRKVLAHVIESELLYARLATHLRGLPQPEAGAAPEAPVSVTAATEALVASRAALEAAIDGVDEESFYRLAAVGHEEYSILSLLENVALHDREHGPQIQEILTATGSA